MVGCPFWRYIFSQSYKFFSLLLIYGGLGVWVLDWVLVKGFDGVWGLWCGAFWVLLGWGSPYKHRRITLGKKPASLTTPDEVWTHDPSTMSRKRYRLSHDSLKPSRHPIIDWSYPLHITSTHALSNIEHWSNSPPNRLSTRKIWLSEVIFC